MMPGFSCTQHRHYQAGCPDCQRAECHYDRRRRRAIADGTWQPSVPLDQVRAHIDKLRAAGMSVAGIAKAAGLAQKTVYPIAASSAGRRYVHGPTAAAILAVQPARTLPAGHMYAVGTGRRIRALVAIGYSLTDIARRLDRHLQQVWEWAHDRQETVTCDSAVAVADLYEQLSGTPGRSVRARNDAGRKGWPPPLAWDDNIDDPDAQPDLGGDGDDICDEVVVRRALAGQMPYSQLRQPERIEAYRRLVATGAGPAAIRRRLNINGFVLMRLEALARQEPAADRQVAA